MLKTLVTLIILAAVGMTVVIVLAWLGQERVVFQPPPDAAVPTSGARRMDFVGADGTPLLAYLVGEPAAVRDAGLVIHFHGNAEIAAYAVPWARELSERSGVAVLVAEYRGYAGLPGKPTYVASVRDARTLWTIAQAELGATREGTSIHGFSLGSAVATELAATVMPRSLVLEAPFTSAREMAARMGPFLGGPLWRLISRVHYDTRARVAALDVPVWVAHGERDMVIPLRMGRGVFAAARSKGELITIPHAGHNDLRAGRAYWPWLVRAVRAP